MSDSRKIALLVEDEFEQVEFTEPKKALEEAGFTVDVVADKGEVQGLNHIEPGDKFAVTRALGNVSPADYDAVVIPGGTLNSDKLRMNEKARVFVNGMNDEGKIIAAICHGPWLLVSSGLAEGKKLTSYFTVQDDIRNAGGEWVDEEVVIDGNIITSRKPDDIPAFNKAILEKLE
jgi:protease I